MTLRTLVPADGWDPADHASAVETLAALEESYVFRVWCDDGCSDCRALLPAFGAALEAAGVADDRVVQHPTERLPEGRKRGPAVEAYDIERIPTVVVERDGEEVARFVEDEGEPIAEHLAGELAALDATS